MSLTVNLVCCQAVVTKLFDEPGFNPQWYIYILSAFISKLVFEYFGLRTCNSAETELKISCKEYDLQTFFRISTMILIIDEIRKWIRFFHQSEKTSVVLVYLYIYIISNLS